MASCPKCGKPTKEYSRHERDGMTHVKYVCSYCGKSNTFIAPPGPLRNYLNAARPGIERTKHKEYEQYKAPRYRPFTPTGPTPEQIARDEIFHEIFGTKPTPKLVKPGEYTFGIDFGSEFPSVKMVRSFLHSTGRNILNFRIEESAAGFWQLTFWNPRFPDECTTAVMLKSEPSELLEAGIDPEVELRKRMEYATETLPVT